MTGLNRTLMQVMAAGEATVTLQRRVYDSDFLHATTLAGILAAPEATLRDMLLTPGIGAKARAAIGSAVCDALEAEGVEPARLARVRELWQPGKAGTPD